MKRFSLRQFPAPKEHPLAYFLLAFTIFVCAWRISDKEFPEQNIIFYNRTASLPIGFYLAWPIGDIGRGDIIIYKPPQKVREFALARGYLNNENTLLMKRVKAVAGDTYKVDKQNTFYVRDRYVGMASQRDSQNRPLPQIQQEKEYIVPDDEFLPVGDTANSFDGRYTGTVPLRAIKTRVIPIFVTW